MPEFDYKDFAAQAARNHAHALGQAEGLQVALSDLASNQLKRLYVLQQESATEAKILQFELKGEMSPQLDGHFNPQVITLETMAGAILETYNMQAAREDHPSGPTLEVEPEILILGADGVNYFYPSYQDIGFKVILEQMGPGFQSGFIKAAEDDTNKVAYTHTLATRTALKAALRYNGYIVVTYRPYQTPKTNKQTPF